MPTRSLRLPLVLLAVMAVTGGCVSASAGWTYAPAPSITPAPSSAASGEPSSAPSSADPNTVMISAFGIKFEQTGVSAPGGTPFKIEFDNKDPGTPHNVAIHEGSATGPELFVGDVFPGVDVRTYDVPALDPGEYAFVCTVHPTMIGTLSVK